jgi:hypothetical protein
MKTIINNLWAQWKVLAHKIGGFQSRLILSVFYYVLFMPFAMGVKLFSDPLRLNSVPRWLTRRDLDDSSTHSARRQF